MAEYSRKFLDRDEFESIMEPRLYAPSRLYNTPQQWANQFYKRALYKNVSAAHKARYAKELLSNPLLEFSFQPITPKSTSALNTSSIYPLSWADLKRLEPVSCASERIDDFSIDEWALVHNLPNSAFGHLKVNLNASDQDLVADFTKWLRLTRERTEKASPLPSISGLKKELPGGYLDFFTKLVLPYFDILFYCEVHGRQISADAFLTGYYRPSINIPNRSFLTNTQKLIDKYINIPNALALAMK